ncbi:MAG: response regulator [Candidatus Eisenbacteria bacterium]|uniref:Response regulator n=1 Tax=Eiseniibacteriota bacterium TaxID=2212470 RepID=A0A538U9V1_UNCEI|nr:MAG: response regulator [Candidatus Eisenbacteria bacterium]
MAKGRILVVDDEIYIVHILDFSLGMEGYEVITALDGEQALEKARSEKPDLIVLDIMMPKLDGYETCKLLKAEEGTKHIPVILLSAKGRNVDQKIGFEVGADDYITKPFSPRKLVERINAILGQNSSHASPPADPRLVGRTPRPVALRARPSPCRLRACPSRRSPCRSRCVAPSPIASPSRSPNASAWASRCRRPSAAARAAGSWSS